jgi:geranylgeranyl diphosphate synthase type II
MGAINAYASDEDQQHLYAFGKHMGIAFQLLDDLLDAFAEDSEKFGKQVGGDILSGKKTFLLLKAMEIANTKQKKELMKLLKLKAKDADKKIDGMLALYTELNIKQICEQEADKHNKMAVDYLDKVDANKIKKNKLKNFANELLMRQV